MLTAGIFFHAVIPMEAIGYKAGNSAGKGQNNKGIEEQSDSFSILVTIF